MAIGPGHSGRYRLRRVLRLSSSAAVIIAASTVPISWPLPRASRFLKRTTGSGNAFLALCLACTAGDRCGVAVFGAVEQSDLAAFAGLRTTHRLYRTERLPAADRHCSGQCVLSNSARHVESTGLATGDYVLYLCAGIGAARNSADARCAAQTTPLLILVLFVWGGMISGFYTVGLAHLGSRLKGADLARGQFGLCVLLFARHDRWTANFRHCDGLV